MKRIWTPLIGIMLSVCLTLYGSVSMAYSGSDSAFAMEICADGVSQTVLIAADGSPVEPNQYCPDCLTCCQVTGVLTPTISSAPPTFVLLDIEPTNLSGQDPVLSNRNIHPAPRGPPAMQLSMLNGPMPIIFDQLVPDQKTRSDGRPHSKDANA